MNGAGGTEARPPLGKDPVCPKLDLEVNELVIGYSSMYSLIHTLSEHPRQTISLVVHSELFLPPLCSPHILTLGLALWLAGASSTCAIMT